MKIHPLTFLWSIIRPYRYLYLMMLMAPIISNISPMMYHYAVKLLIDLFTQNEKITLTQSYKPVMWFLLAQLAVDGPWRIHNFAQLKAIPWGCVKSPPKARKYPLLLAIRASGSDC